MFENRLLIFLLFTFICPAVSACTTLAPSRAQEESLFKVLVFSKTDGFRHGSIDEGVAAIQALGADYGFAVDASEDAALFSDSGLAPYTALGHTEASYSEPLFRQHLLGGILYAAGIELSPVSYLPFMQAP